MNELVAGTPPTAKRRRLNGFSTPAILSRPFKSPLRSPTTTQDRFPGHQSFRNEGRRNGKDVQIDPARREQHTASSEGFAKSYARSTDSFKPNAPSPLQDAMTVLTAAQDGEDSQAFSAAQRAQTKLLNSIADVRRDIDALKQALNLTSGAEEAELEALISKWRGAAQEAAEEAFGRWKDRVDELGGMAVWKKQESDRKALLREWEQPLRELDRSGGADEGEGCGDVEDAQGDYDDAINKYERRAIMVTNEQYEDEGETVEVGKYSSETPSYETIRSGEDDTTFCMEMMLGLLNIDLDAIGYCKERQSWAD